MSQNFDLGKEEGTSGLNVLSDVDHSMYFCGSICNFNKA